jgi:hypothetical protein
MILVSGEIETIEIETMGHEAVEDDSRMNIGRHRAMNETFGLDEVEMGRERDCVNGRSRLYCSTAI